MAAIMLNEKQPNQKRAGWNGHQQRKPEAELQRRPSRGPKLTNGPAVTTISKMLCLISEAR